MQTILDDLGLKLLDLGVEASYLLLSFSMAFFALLDGDEIIPQAVESSKEEKMLRSVELVFVVVDELFNLAQCLELQVLLLEFCRYLCLIDEVEKLCAGYAQRAGLRHCCRGGR